MDKRIKHAEATVRREREASVWKDRDEAGRSARQAEPSRQSQSDTEVEGGAGPKRRAQVTQGAGG